MVSSYRGVDKPSSKLFSIFPVDSSVTKSYYYSNVASNAMNALKVCQSFDMILASIQNQAEYNRIASLLRIQDNWHEAVVAGYRSELNDKEWVDVTDKITFNIHWQSGEPNNADGAEHCLSKIVI